MATGNPTSYPTNRKSFCPPDASTPVGSFGKISADQPASFAHWTPGHGTRPAGTGRAALYVGRVPSRGEVSLRFREHIIPELEETEATERARLWRDWLSLWRSREGSVSSDVSLSYNFLSRFSLLTPVQI